MMKNGLSTDELSLHIEEIIRQQIESDEPLGSGTLLLDDLGMDSIERVELNQKMEEKFEVAIPFADLRKCKTIHDVVCLVEQTLQKTRWMDR